MHWTRIQAATAALALLIAPALLTPPAAAQNALGATADNPATPVKDASMLKPPAGARVAIVEWEDLECPFCARAFPAVHLAADQYHVPLVRYDFLIPGHAWSPEAAVFARYLQDKVSPELAADYRRKIFSSQARIGGPEDLRRVTQQFMEANGKPMPAVVDPTGQFRREVDADKALGAKMGLTRTPTIFVVTPTHWTEVLDLMQLDDAIQKAQAETSGAPKPVAHKPAAAAHKATAK